MKKEQNKQKAKGLIAVDFSQRIKKYMIRIGLQPHSMWLKPLTFMKSANRQLKQTAIKQKAQAQLTVTVISHSFQSQSSDEWLVARSLSNSVALCDPDTSGLSVFCGKKEKNLTTKKHREDTENHGENRRKSQLTARSLRFAACSYLKRNSTVKQYSKHPQQRDSSEEQAFRACELLLN